MKFYRFVCLMLLILLLIPVLPSCECEHVWEAPSCTKGSVCSKCKTVRDDALGHDWETESDDVTLVCIRCGLKDTVTGAVGDEDEDPEAPTAGNGTTSSPDSDTTTPGTSADSTTADGSDSDTTQTTPSETTAPETTAPVTTAPVTTAPDITTPVTTAPITTPVTTAPVTTQPVTTTAPVTTSPSTMPQETTLPEVITTIPHTFEEISVDFGDIPNIPMEEGITNILLIGTDALNNTSNGRSDCMIIASINPAKSRVVLTSIMRDTYVKISDAGTSNKINASHAYGGTPTLIKTIQENFGIEIHKYCRAKYSDFVKVCEYLGGLDLTLTLAEIRYINDGLKNDPHMQTIYKNCKNEGFNLTVTSSIPENMAGKEIHLNADALFVYARARKLAGGDYKRTERQRTVVTLALNKIKNLSAGQLAALMDKCLPFITTDLTRSDCLKFIWNAPTYAKYDIASTRLPMDGYFIDTYVSSGGKTSWLEIKSAKKDEMMKKWASIVND